MYKVLALFSVVAATLFSACNNESSKTETTEQASMPMQNAAAPADVKMVAHRFQDIDPKQAAAVNAIVQEYLQIKNALVNGKSDEAAQDAKALNTSLINVDKSLFTAQQNEVYEGIAGDLRAKATQIADNAGNIDQQRDAFASLSKQVYELVKAFGAGTTLYQAHCPMFHDGSIWLSNSKEIQNPYYGAKMMDCGTVEEQIQ